MEEIELVNFVRWRLRKKRLSRDRYNPLENLNDQEFIELYRVRKEIVQNLLQRGVVVNPKARRNHSTPAVIQLCSTLNILATGCTLRKTAELLGISYPTTHRVFWNTINDLVLLAPTFIKFPKVKEVQNIASQYFEISHIPNVIGCIDGSLIALKKPTLNEHIYINRKGVHSINVLIVSGPNLSINFINAKYPGSAHDAYIYQMSGLSNFLTNAGYESSIILGDSAFPLENHFLVHYLDPQNKDEERFNKVFRIVRCSVERALGVWKARWRIVDKQGGPIRCAPDKASKIIVPTAILHNMCILANQPNPEPLPEEVEDDINTIIHGGASIRENIVKQLKNERNKLRV